MFYFSPFESRQPPPPVPYSAAREWCWQVLATMSVIAGGWYIWWRWSQSLNPEALWFAIPLVIAETLAYVGLLLFTVNLWRTADTPMQPPPATLSDCVDDPEAPERPLSVDVFFATYNEDVELVRLSVRDALRIDYPHPIDLRIHVLDDGRRPEVHAMAEQEGVNYITRGSNIGFKAGNLRNAMEHTHGDFILICDADTRPFPQILREMLGYFRDPQVAWVQSPQWFYDLPEGQSLSDWLGRWLRRPGRALGRALESVFGPIQVGDDPLVNSPAMFYDVILRRRNWANAVFCCGAGSIHRREAIMEAALKSYGRQILKDSHRIEKKIRDPMLRSDFGELHRQQIALETELTPYKFHVSEDIYTSIVLHSDRDRHWRSVYHPNVLTRMLSPQDLEAWMVQRFKYAGGTLDIAVHDNPCLMPGMSWAQRLMYGATIWSYFACLWNVVFLAAPIIYLFTGIAPVSAYNRDFFAHALPFLFLNELATMVGTWGVPGFKGKSSYLAFFSVNFRALWTVARGQKIKFKVTPKDRQSGRFLHLVIPQLVVAVLTLAGLLWAAAGLLIGWNHNLYGLIANLFWGVNNIVLMSSMLTAALWQPDAEPTAPAAAPAMVH